MVFNNTMIDSIKNKGRLQTTRSRAFLNFRNKGTRLRPIFFMLILCLLSSSVVAAKDPAANNSSLKNSATCLATLKLP